MNLFKLAIFYTGSLLLFSGCTPSTSLSPNTETNSSLNAKFQQEELVDVTLQKIELTKNGIFTDMKTIAFEYKNITDSRVKGVYVYRMSADSLEGSEYYDTIDNRFATHYVDRNVKPGHNYQYYFKTFSDKHESVPSDLISVNSLPILESVSWIRSVEGMPQTAKIIWRPHSNQKVVSYIIERKTLEKDEWKQIEEIDGRLNAEFIDKDLQNNYIYNYRVRVKTYNDIISKPSKEVRVITKPLPKSVMNLMVTNNLPKVIELNWEKTNTKDFGLYHLYRSSDVNGDLDLIATLHNNHFIDNIGEDGKQYFYKVSVVDNDGLESIHQKIALQGSTLAIPKAPSITKAKFINGKIELAWKDMEGRAKTYNIIKKYRKGWLDSFEDEFTDITATSFSDANLESEVTYHYQIISVDENGLKSNSSLEVEIKIPKLLELEGVPDTPLEVINYNDIKIINNETIQIEDKKLPNKEVIVPVENLDLSEI